VSALVVNEIGLAARGSRSRLRGGGSSPGADPVMTGSRVRQPGEVVRRRESVFKVSGTDNETTSLLVLEGELDVATAPVLLEYLQLLNAGSPANICLDLSGLEFVDSTGLGLLVTMHKRARTEGTSFTLVAPSEQFLKLLEVTGLDGFFDCEFIH